MKENFIRFFCFNLVFVYGISLVPAKELNFEYEQKLLQEANLDVSGVEEKNNIVLDVAESFSSGAVNGVNASWEEDCSGDEKDRLVIYENEYTQLLQEKLREIEQQNFNNKLDAQNYWEGLTSSLYDNFVRKHMLDDFVLEFSSFADQREKELFNEVLFRILYDTDSLKFISDQNSAEYVVQNLLEDISSSLEQMYRCEYSYDETYTGIEDINLGEQSGEDKIAAFEKNYIRALELWEKCENEFLTVKKDWENNKKTVLDRELASWRLAWEKLEAKKDEWLTDFEDKYKKEMDNWNLKRENFQKELELSLALYQNDLSEKEKNQYEIFLAYKNSYEQRRVIVNEIAKNVRQWFSNWGSKYRDLYSYWKTEPLLEEPEEITLDEVNRILEEIKIVRNKLAEDESIEEYSVYDESLEMLDKWCSLILEYDNELKKDLNEIKRICIDENSLWNTELNCEMENLTVLEEFWSDEQLMWKEVLEYEKNYSSSIESYEESYTAQNEAQKEYELLILMYEEKKSQTEKLKQNIAEIKQQIDKTVEEYNRQIKEYKNDYSEYESGLYNEVWVFVNSKFNKVKNYLEDIDQTKKESLEEFSNLFNKYMADLFETDGYKLSKIRKSYDEQIEEKEKESFEQEICRGITSDEQRKKILEEYYREKERQKKSMEIEKELYSQENYDCQVKEYLYRFSAIVEEYNNFDISREDFNRKIFELKDDGIPPAVNSFIELYVYYLDYEEAERGEENVLQKEISQVNEIYGDKFGKNSLLAEEYNPMNFMNKWLEIQKDDFGLSKYFDEKEVDEKSFNLTVSNSTKRSQALYELTDVSEQIQGLKDCLESLIDYEEKYSNYKNEADAQKEYLKKEEERYKCAISLLEAENKNSLYEKYFDAVTLYNKQIEENNLFYERVKEAKQKYKTACAIVEWGQNEYLHVDKENSNYLTPYEKYEYSSKMLDSVRDSKSKILTENSNDESSYEEFLEQLNVRMDEYSVVYQVYQKFLALFENKTNELERNQIIQKIAFDSIVNHYSAEEYYYLVSNNGFYNDRIKFVVKMDDNGNEYYDFEYCLSGEKKEAELTEKELMFFTYDLNSQSNESDEFINLASQYGAAWLKSFNDKSYSLDTVLLAMKWVVSQASAEELSKWQESPMFVFADDQKLTGDLPEKIKEVNIPENYNRGLEHESQRAYEILVSQNALDEIARLGVYAQFILSREMGIQSLYRNVLGQSGLNGVNEGLNKKIDELNVMIGIDTGILLSSVACMAIPGLGAIFGGVYAAALAAVIFHVKEKSDVEVVEKDVNSLLTGINLNYQDTKNMQFETVSKWVESKENIEKAWNDIRYLLSGSESDEVLTYEKFFEVVETSLLQKGNYNYELAEKFVDIGQSGIKNDLQNIFDSISETSQEFNVLDVLNVFEQYFNLRSANEYENCEYYASLNNLGQKWNQFLYDKKISELFFKNYIDKVEENYEIELNYLYDLALNEIEKKYQNQLAFEKNYKSASNEIYNQILLDEFDYEAENYKAQMENILEAGKREWDSALSEFNTKYSVWKRQWDNEYEQEFEQIEKDYEEIIQSKINWLNSQMLNLSAGIYDCGDDSYLQTADNKVKEFKVIEDIKENCWINSVCTDLTRVNRLEVFADNLTSSILDNGRSWSELIDIDTSRELQTVFEECANLDKAIMEASRLMVQGEARQQVLEQLSRIKADLYDANLAVEKWETEMVRENGYTVDSQIHREAVVDSLVFGTVRKNQTVHKYEWFEADYIDGVVFNNFSGSGGNVLEEIKNSYYSADYIKTRIFGDENITGEFNKHVGTDTILVDEPDLEKTKYENILINGSGQLGKIMLDFKWNSLENRRGYSELDKPVYEKKFTHDNKIFGIELPTLKDVISIICDVVGTFVPGIGYIDDGLFLYMDLTLGKVNQSNAAQKFLSPVISVVLSELGSVAGDALSSIAKTELGKIVAKGAVQSTQNYLNNVSDYALGFAGSGKEFNWDEFAQYLGSGEAVGAAVGGFVSGSAGQYFAGSGNSKIFGFNTRQQSDVLNFSKFLGNGAAALTELGISGKTKINLLNVNGIGLFELNLGRDGVSAKIGSKGYGLYADHAIKGASVISTGQKIAQTVGNYNLAEEQSRNLLYGLQSQLGYGDDVQKQLLNEILSGQAEIIFDDSMTHGALARTQNTDGRRIIYLNASKTNIGVLLSHEAYRNGIWDGDIGQSDETSQAVIGHKAFVDSLVLDNRIGDGLVSLNDLIDSKFMDEAIDKGILSEYISSVYEKDEDFWKVTCKGQLIFDGDGWLKDLSNHYILDKNGNKVGAQDPEEGLYNILFGDSSLPQPIMESRRQFVRGLMTEAKLKERKDGTWINNGYEVSYDQKINMERVMEWAGGTVNEYVFNRWYNNTVDCDIARHWGVLLGFEENRKVYDSSLKRYSALVDKHKKDCNNPIALKLKYKTVMVNQNNSKCVEIFKVDENNPFLDSLLKQYEIGQDDVAGWGCKFMDTIAVAQLMTGNIFNEEQVLEIFNSGIKNNGIINDYEKYYIDSSGKKVENPNDIPGIDKDPNYKKNEKGVHCYIEDADTVSKLAFEKAGLPFKSLYIENNREAEKNEIRVSMCNLKTSGHWVLRVGETVIYNSYFLYEDNITRNQFANIQYK